MKAELFPFTKARLAGLPLPPEGRVYVRDARSPDLYLAVSSKGTKSFLVYKWGAGRPQRVTLGRFDPDRPGAMTIDQARRKVSEVVAQIQGGRRPVEEKRARDHAPTVAALAESYIERHAKPRKRSWREDERILGLDVLPRWGRRRAAEVTRRDVLELLDSIVDRGAPTQANRTLACIRKMFAFGIQRGFLEATPCAALSAPTREQPRDRVLAEEEIHALWNGLDDAPASASVRLILRFMLASAQRPGECRGVEWTDLDLAGGWWTIPAEKAKNRLSHRVPLNATALRVLGEARFVNEGSRYVFRSPVGDKPVRADSMAPALKLIRERFGLAHFTPHDIRRSVASHMTSLGVERLVVKKILNHVETDVTAIYDRHSYDREKRGALLRWGRRLEEIVKGEQPRKVVALRGAEEQPA